MVKKSRSGSEKRKLSHRVDVRLDAVTYGGVHYRADALKITDASVVRDILIDEFGCVDPDAQMVKMKRGTNQKITPEIKEALKFSADLNRIGNNYNQSVRQIHSARHSGDLRDDHFGELKSQQAEILVLLRDIKRVMAGSVDIEEDF